MNNDLLLPLLLCLVFGGIAIWSGWKEHREEERARGQFTHWFDDRFEDDDEDER